MADWTHDELAHTKAAEILLKNHTRFKIQQPVNLKILNFLWLSWNDNWKIILVLKVIWKK